MLSFSVSVVEHFLDVVEIRTEITVGIDEIVHRIAGVENSGVVFTPESLTDGGKGCLGHAAAQIHRYLTGLDYLTLACLRHKHILGDAEVLTDRILNLGNRYLNLRLGYDLLDDVARQRQRNVLLGKSGIGYQ